MPRFSRLILPLVLVAIAAGCSSSKKRNTVDPYATEEKFCAEWAKAACKPKVVEQCSAVDVDSCIAKASSYCMGLVPPSYASSKYAKECVLAVGKAFEDGILKPEELAVVRDLAAPCDRLNEGSKGAGETCSASDECNALVGDVALTCIIKSGQSMGSCEVPVEVGGGFPCTGADETCADGFYCDGSNCIAKKGDGQPCTEDVPCGDDFQCLGVPGDMKCAPKGDVSATCTADTDCKSGICAKPATGSGKCVNQVTLTPTDPMCSHLG